MSAPELLPCPFCGETPVVDCAENHSEYGGPDSWLVCCGTAYCYGNAFSLDNSFHSKAHACEAWNTRSAPAAVPGPLEGERDKERLDWLEANYVHFLGYSPYPDMGGNQWSLRPTSDYRTAMKRSYRTAREAIDAAMARTAAPASEGKG